MRLGLALFVSAGVVLACASRSRGAAAPSRPTAGGAFDVRKMVETPTGTAEEQRAVVAEYLLQAAPALERYETRGGSSAGGSMRDAEAVRERLWTWANGEADVPVFALLSDQQPRVRRLALLAVSQDGRTVGKRSEAAVAAAVRAAPQLVDMARGDAVCRRAFFRLVLRIDRPGLWLTAYVLLGDKDEAIARAAQETVGKRDLSALESREELAAIRNALPRVLARLQWVNIGDGMRQRLGRATSLLEDTIKRKTLEPPLNRLAFELLPPGRQREFAVIFEARSGSQAVLALTQSRRLAELEDLDVYLRSEDPELRRAAALVIKRRPVGFNFNPVIFSHLIAMPELVEEPELLSLAARVLPQQGPQQFEDLALCALSSTDKRRQAVAKRLLDSAAPPPAGTGHWEWDLRRREVEAVRVEVERASGKPVWTPQSWRSLRSAIVWHWVEVAANWCSVTVVVLGMGLAGSYLAVRPERKGTSEV